MSDQNITDEMIDKVFKSMYTPSLHTFKVAVGRAIKRNYQNINILDIAKKIVGTQSKITATEQEALDYIEKRAQS
ncbi:MAG: hypothetical protein COB02_18230 [Candidatus Cloacimonadota bacterium]|nr:MAG: hypothetical protein COB02_18230 [Candidatus Cloacimonadota bacterium]